MKITSESLRPSRQKITVYLTEEEVRDYYAKAEENLAKEVKMSGFRPGKVPKTIARKQLSPEQIRDEAVRLAVSLGWREALKDIKKLPIEDPVVEVEELETEKGGRLVFLYDSRPEVKLGNWKDIRVAKEKVTPVSEKDVESALKNFAQSRAQRFVKDAPAAKGDELLVAMKGVLAGQQIKKLTVEKMVLRLGQGGLIPGLEEKLLGIKRGEKRQFSLLLPANHFEKDLAGRKVDFEVEAKEIYSVVVPEVTDRLAKEAGYQTLTEMKQKLREYMKMEQEASLKAKQGARWLEAFEKLVTVDLPQSLIDKEVERLRQQWQEFLAQRNLASKDWLEARQTTIAEMEKGWRDDAVRRLKIGLGVAEIAKEKGRELKTESDFRAFLAELSGSQAGVSE